jgi:hypothetical protein
LAKGNTNKVTNKAIITTTTSDAITFCRKMESVVVHSAVASTAATTA